MKHTKIFLIIVLLLIIGNVSAVKYVDYNFREGIIQTNGNLIQTNIPVNDVNVIGFVCNNRDCSSVSSSLFGGTISNPVVLTSTQDSIQLAYPTQLQSRYGYGIYYYKDDYVLWEQNPKWNGNNNPNNPEGPYTKYLSKFQQCNAPIDSFTVINEVFPNEPIQIDVSASLDATIRNLLKNSGPLEFIPPSIQDQYQLEVNVNVEIFDENNNIVFNENEILNLDPEETAEVSYTWMPTIEGDYLAVASTDVTDAKCLDSITQSTSMDITVLEEIPRNMCYTLLNNLALSDPDPDVNDLVTINTEKISNEADNNGILTALATDIVLTITNLDTGNIEIINDLISANPDTINFMPFNFNWLISEAGNYLIELVAVADNCAFDDNLDARATLGVSVSQPPEGLPECSDGIDNDNDELIDMDDPGCDSPLDDDEFNAPVVLPQCSDGLDNDGDGLIDMDDPGCSDTLDDDEFNPPVVLPQCSDGLDNDGDGLIDMDDPGCSDTLDDDEFNPPVVLPQCSDGLDNDGDGLIDIQDPGCYNANQQYNPLDNDESNSGSPFQCSDTIDNDNDGLIDYSNDPGCTSLFDDDESDISSAPQCSDGIDNDNDGAIDFPNDFGCDNPDDDDETNNGNTECSDGIDNDNDGDIDQDDNDCASPIDDNEGRDTSNKKRGSTTKGSLSLEIVELTPETLNCRDNINIIALVVNDGNKDLEDVYVTISESSLNLYERTAKFDLNDNDNNEVEFNLKLEDAKNGIYSLMISAHFEDGEIDSSVTRRIELRNCNSGNNKNTDITGFSIVGEINKEEKSGFLAAIKNLLSSPLALIAAILIMVLLLVLIIYTGGKIAK